MNTDTNRDDPSSGTQDIHTLPEIISSLIQHPSLVLLIKKVIDVCSSHDIPLPENSSELSEADRHCIAVTEFACIHGAPCKMQCATRTDILMTALINGLEQLTRTRPSSGSNRILQSTFTECENSLSQRPSHQRLHPDKTLNTACNSDSAASLHPQTRKGLSTRLKESSRQVLLDWFDSHYDKPYPTEAEKSELALRAGLSIKQVNIFFGNRRMRIKRKMMAMPATQGHHSGFDRPDGLSAQAKWKSVLAKMHAYPRQSSSSTSPSGKQRHYSTHGNTNGCTREIHPSSTSSPSFNPQNISSNGGNSFGYESSPHCFPVQFTTSNRRSRNLSKFSELPLECSVNTLPTFVKSSDDQNDHVYHWLQSHMNNPVLTSEEKMQVMKFSRVNLGQLNNSRF